jgi:hypothetical protein
MTGQPHEEPPDSELGADATIEMQSEHASVIRLTLDFHVAVNMFAAAYLNADELRELHENVLEMLCPHPRKVVWAKDAAVLDNQDAPAKHTCQVHPWPSPW